MQYSLKLSLLALTISVAVTMLLFIFVAHSPYILGVGCILAIYLAKVPSSKSAAIHGAIAATPLAVYVNLTDSFGSIASPTTLTKSASVLLFAIMGGVLGVVSIWIRDQLKKGTTFFG